MESEELFRKRCLELAQKCYQKNQYTFTGFLGLSELSDFYRMEKELSYVPYTVWGGSELCERAMVRFGSKEMLGYEEEFPIVCLLVKPLAAKFADALSHRDFLGALMNLGIERSALGDILIEENTAYVFCLDKLADFLADNVNRVRHTAVVCSRTRELPSFSEKEMQEIKLQTASERIDGVLAKVYRLSRSETIELFRQKKVFVNGRLCENNSRLLKGGDTVTARGRGKFIYDGQQGLSKKGKLYLAVRIYGSK